MKTELISSMGVNYLSSGAKSQVKADGSFSDQIQKAEDSLKTEGKESQTLKNHDAKTEAGAEEKNEVKSEPAKQKDEKNVEENLQVQQQEKLETTDEPELDSETVDGILTLLSQQLGVSTEELQNSMEKLGMNAMDLQNPQNLIKLMVDVKELSSPMELLTDEQLAKSFKEISAQVNEIVDAKTNLADMGTQQETEGIEVVKMTEDTEESEEKLESAVDTMDETIDVEGNQMESGHSEEQDAEQNSMTEIKTVALNQSQAVTNPLDKLINNVQEALVDRVDDEMSQNIVKQVTDAVKLSIKSDVTSLEMQLYPEHLGKISIQIAAKNGVMTAQIMAENEAAKVALESQVDTLKQSFEDQGLKVESVEVMVSTKGFEQDKNNGNSDGSNKNQERKVRKGLLDELNQEDEDITEDENVRETLGNTVNYTA